MTGADTDYLTGMELCPLEPKFNVLALGYFISLLTSTAISTDSEIFTSIEVPCIAQLQTVKRPKQLSITLSRVEYSLVLAGFQMHSCWFLKGPILNGCYFQYSKCSGLHFRKFNPFRPTNLVLLTLLLAIFLCKDLKQISIVK